MLQVWQSLRQESKVELAPMLVPLCMEMSYSSVDAVVAMAQTMYGDLLRGEVSSDSTSGAPQVLCGLVARCARSFDAQAVWCKTYTQRAWWRVHRWSG